MTTTGKLWQNSLNKNEKLALSQKIAGITGMDERAVEKDFRRNTQEAFVCRGICMTWKNSWIRNSGKKPC